MVLIPADSRWRSDGQVLNLEHHVYVRRELDALAVGQTEHLVVVQYGVHVLDPESVHRAITDHPLMSL